MGAWIAAINLFQIDLVNHEIPYDTVMKRYLCLRYFPFERTGVAIPRSPVSLGVTEKYTILTNIAYSTLLPNSN